MINGDSSEFATSDPPDDGWQDLILDGGDASPVSSRYSSCGESEFERYCSANSVMGTPSLCGSDFGGSLKSFRLGDDTTALENLSWKSRYDRKFEDFKVPSLAGSQRFESRDSKSELVEEINNNLVGEGSARTDNELNLFDEITQQEVNVQVIKEDVLNSQSDVEFDEGETSSRYEHSEGEDSMFGCGTDDEKQVDFYQRRNGQYLGEASDKNENSLGMNSSIAFGSDDWDDFMQGHQENSLVSMTAGEQDHLISPFPTTTLWPSTGVAQEDAKDNSLVNKQVQDADDLAVYNSSRNSANPMRYGETEQVEIVKNMLVTTNQVETSSVSNICETGQDPVTETAPFKEKLSISNGGLVKVHGSTRIEEVSGIDDSCVSESIELEKTKLQLDPLFDITSTQLCSAPVEATEDQRAKFHKDSKAYALQSLVDNDIKRNLDSPTSSNLFEERPSSIKVNFQFHALNKHQFSFLFAMTHTPIGRLVGEVLGLYVHSTNLNNNLGYGIPNG